MCDEPSTARWGPVVVLRNCRWAAPVVAPVDRIRRHLAPSVMHKNKYVRDETRRERKGKGEMTWRIHEFYILWLSRGRDLFCDGKLAEFGS